MFKPTPNTVGAVLAPITKLVDQLEAVLQIQHGIITRTNQTIAEAQAAQEVAKREAALAITRIDQLNTFLEA